MLFVSVVGFRGKFVPLEAARAPDEQRAVRSALHDEAYHILFQTSNGYAILRSKGAHMVRLRYEAL